jgi:hypothetical protein
MSHEEFTTMAQVSAELNAIRQTLEAQNQQYAARRLEDDRRELVATSDRKELLDRVNAHGTRTTALEANWAAFFGEQGAFRMVVKQGVDQAKDIKNLSKAQWMGVGLVVGINAVLILLLRH